MVKIRASFSVTGYKFSPSVFSQINSVKLVRANEPGDIGTIGRYRGRATPYGSASVEISDKAEADWSRFDELLRVL